jgi:hypothetical protein
MLERSLRPFLRPDDMSRRADYRPAPSINPAVDENATRRVDLDMTATILLGVSGTDEDRCALMRCPDGAVERVTAGGWLGEDWVASVEEDCVVLARGPHTRRVALL